MKAHVVLVAALVVPLLATTASAQTPAAKPAAPKAQPKAPPPPPPPPPTTTVKPPPAPPAQPPPPPPPPPPAPPTTKAPPPPPQPPFPVPKLIQISSELRCDWGPIKSKDKGDITIETPAGAFTFSSGDARVVGPNANAKLAPENLDLGQVVRVYYRVKNGARALEIDLVQVAAAAK